MKKTVVLFLFVTSYILYSTNPEWLKIDASTIGIGPQNYEYSIGGIKALSDSSVWFAGSFDGFMEYKNGIWRHHDYIQHYANQRIILWDLYDMTDGFLDSKWISQLNSSKLIRMKRHFDTIYADYPYPNGPLNFCVKDNYLWMTSRDTSLIRYDGENWTAYRYVDSTRDPNLTLGFGKIVKDSYGNLWLEGNSLVKFDGTNFHKYDSTNTDIPNTYFHDISIDSQNNIWMNLGYKGESWYPPVLFGKFDGTNFTMFDSTNSPIKENDYFGFSNFVDKSDNVWLTMQSKIMRLSGSTWTVFDSTNSPLIYKSLLLGITQDVYGNIWFGSDLGIYLYNESGVVLPGVTSAINEGNEEPGLIIKPNPADEKVSISIGEEYAGELQLVITDLEGRVILTRKLEEKELSINTEMLNNGTYLVKVTVKGNTKTGKFIINR